VTAGYVTGPSAPGTPGHGLYPRVPERVIHVTPPRVDFPVQSAINGYVFHPCRLGTGGSSCPSPVAERWLVRGGFHDVTDLRYHASPTIDCLRKNIPARQGRKFPLDLHMESLAGRSCGWSRLGRKLGNSPPRGPGRPMPLRGPQGSRPKCRLFGCHSAQFLNAE